MGQTPEEYLLSDVSLPIRLSWLVKGNFLFANPRRFLEPAEKFLAVFNASEDNEMKKAYSDLANKLQRQITVAKGKLKAG